MKIKFEDYLVAPKAKVKLKDWPTTVKPLYESKDEYRAILAEHSTQLSDLQSLLNASASYSMLIIFQAMDAGGKDGMIKHVMSGVNPQGCDVYSFKTPSAEDRAHDFLWRTNKSLPERGKIGIFNRSYYEEVLIARVHPQVLEAQNIPPALMNKETIWKDRFKSIMDMESHLHRSGTIVLKFYLHISREEQRKRFIARIDEPAKNWKITPADIAERQYWKDYTEAYEEAISTTSTEDCPWFIIPADDKLSSRLIVSQILVKQLADLKLSYPKTDKKRREDLLAIRGDLEK